MLFFVLLKEQLLRKVYRERQNCIARMKAAYQLGLYGNDKKVMSGEAQGLIKEEPHKDAGKAKQNKKQLTIDKAFAKQPTDNKNSFGADPKEVKADTAGGSQHDYYSEAEDLDEYGSDTKETQHVEEEEDMIKHEDLQSGQKKRGRKAAAAKVQPKRGRAKKTEDVKQDK